jgi:hypothetical protein
VESLVNKKPEKEPSEPRKKKNGKKAEEAQTNSTVKMQ